MGRQQEPRPRTKRRDAGQTWKRRAQCLHGPHSLDLRFRATDRRLTRGQAGGWPAAPLSAWIATARRQRLTSCAAACPLKKAGVGYRTTAPLWEASGHRANLRRPRSKTALGPRLVSAGLQGQKICDRLNEKRPDKPWKSITHGRYVLTKGIVLHRSIIAFGARFKRYSAYRKAITAIRPAWSQIRPRASAYSVRL